MYKLNSYRGEKNKLIESSDDDSEQENRNLNLSSTKSEVLETLKKDRKTEVISDIKSLIKEFKKDKE